MFTVAKQIGAAQTSVVPLLAAGIEPCEKKFVWKRCFERHFVTGERRPGSFNQLALLDQENRLFFACATLLEKMDAGANRTI